jgi:hypothetical protein
MISILDKPNRLEINKTTFLNVVFLTRVCLLNFSPKPDLEGFFENAKVFIHTENQ